MPMPELDPSRFYAAVLADPSHTLPLPKDLGGRNFFAEGEVVDSANPFYAHLLADGSLKRKPADDAAEPQGATPEAERPDEPKADDVKPTPSDEPSDDAATKA